MCTDASRTDDPGQRSQMAIGERRLSPMKLHGAVGRPMATIGLSLVLGAIALAPGVAASGATIVSGLQIPATGAQCANPDAVVSYVMTGSLEGCWYIDTVDYKSVSQNGVLATGTERFVGCLGATCGSFSTTFVFTAKYAGDVELHGRCHHPITGGSGGFAGATGSLSFKDQPSGCATYHGTVRLAGS
jgi:hypothetical protein